MRHYGGLGDRHQQNGVNYTLDLNAGLTQVLSDGTNTYLYGNGRISQHATQTEYFLGDALGSVRQLADTAGAVTLTQSYAPYGETISSVGSGASAYQFTGESRDANGLTYLRARYYNSSDGRFLTRDTWNGDYNRPLSLNRWGYVEGNPVNYTDPTGFWITKGDIKNGQAVHSCNCGWIDFHHATPMLANNIHKIIKTAQRLAVPKDTFGYRYRQNSMVVYVSQSVQRNIPYTPIYIENIGYKANVSKNLTGEEQWEVTLSLLKNLSNIREWASVVGGGGSHFLEEDLTSDIIGFNLAHNGYEDARHSDASWRWLAEKCGFSVDRTIAKKRSLSVFENYGDSETIRAWHSPRLTINANISEYLCEIGDLCSSESAWPSAFTATKPDKGNWSYYVPWRGDFLERSGFENIYYSGYMTWR